MNKDKKIVIALVTTWTS